MHFHFRTSGRQIEVVFWDDTRVAVFPLTVELAMRKLYELMKAIMETEQ